jgi:hypothetical protein
MAVPSGIRLDSVRARWWLWDRECVVATLAAVRSLQPDLESRIRIQVMSAKNLAHFGSATVPRSSPGPEPSKIN